MSSQQYRRSRNLAQCKRCRVPLHQKRCSRAVLHQSLKSRILVPKQSTAGSSAGHFYGERARIWWIGGVYRLLPPCTVSLVRLKTASNRHRQKPGLRHLLDEKGNAQAGPIVVHKITSMVVCRPADRLLRQEERPLMVVMDITIIQSALGGWSDVISSFTTGINRSTFLHLAAGPAAVGAYPASSTCKTDRPSPASQLTPDLWAKVQRFVVDAQDWACAEEACKSIYRAQITAPQVCTFTFRWPSFPL